jgi:hypothetical protein
LYDFLAVSSGILTDGCSMASLMALAVARHWATEGAVRSLGPEAALGMRVYASDATTQFHPPRRSNCSAWAAKALAPDSPATKAASTCRRWKAAHPADREGPGLQPFCIVGNAGTVGIGAIDPLEALKSIAVSTAVVPCRWCHRRARLAVAALRAPPGRLPLCDSLAFDLHKWGRCPTTPAACWCVNAACIARLSPAKPSTGAERGGITAGCARFNAYTPLLSRPERAMKIWMTLQTLGSERLAGVFEKNVAQAGYLCELVEPATRSWRRMAPRRAQHCLLPLPRRAGRRRDRCGQRGHRGGATGVGLLRAQPLRLHGAPACGGLEQPSHMRADIEALVQQVQRLGRKASAKLRLAS